MDNRYRSARGITENLPATRLKPRLNSLNIGSDAEHILLNPPTPCILLFDKYMHIPQQNTRFNFFERRHIDH